MEKDALLTVILNDIKEVEMLVQTFQGKTPIMPAFLQLSIQKVDNLRQELELLSNWTGVQPQPEKTKEEKVAPPKPETVIIPSPKIEEPVKAEPIIEQPKPEPVKEKEVLLEMEHTIQPSINEVVVEKPISQPIAKPREITNIPKPPQAETTQIQTHTESHPHKDHAVLGEILITDQKSVNDKLHTTKETSNPAITGTHVEDIRKAIGINDKFLFLRELFGNNSDFMNQTIDELNKLNTFAQAQAFLKSNFSWDMDDETVIAFHAAVRRKF
jgi:hypothetical protein